MNQRQAISDRMRDHYEAFWSQGDPWDFENSKIDEERFQRQLALVNDRRYERVLDLGCGSGEFARLTSDIAKQVTAVDIAPAAIDHARLRCSDRQNVEFCAANMMEYDFHAGGPWDLVVMSESIYCLGWLYPLFDVGWPLKELADAMTGGGRFLLVNTLGKEGDYLLLPWLVSTYRDLVLNVGYELETEQTFRGLKHGIEFDVLMSLFRKRASDNASV